MAKTLKTISLALILLSILISTVFGFIYFFKLKSSEKTETAEKILAKLENQKTSIINLIQNNPPEEIKHSEIYTTAWIPYWDENRGFEAFKQNHEEINSVSPTWFYANSDGALTERNPAGFSEKVQLVHDLGGKIIPSVTNPSSIELSSILNNDKLRSKHITEIKGTALKYNFDGIDIDYENLEAKDKDIFSTFVKELSEELHKDGKLLTIAVLPKSDNIIYQFSPSRQAQDWKEIGKYVDEFRIMGYDWTHNSTTGPGPISPVYWLEEIVKYGVLNISAEKIVLGLPLYGYQWGENGTKALTWEQAADIINTNNLQPIWDDESKENKFLFNGMETWYHDAKTVKERMKIAQKYKLQGVAFWRLGGEDPEIWKN